MEIHISPGKCRALIWPLANFIKAVALKHNHGMGRRGVAQAEIDVMIPQRAGSFRIEFGNRN
jgi:hypothetical protein